MAIWVTKLSCAVAGWFIYGWIGAAIGFLLVGPSVCFLIGTLTVAKDGGLLDAEQRRFIATQFAQDNPDVIEAACRRLSPTQVQFFLEFTVDRVARKALMGSQGYEIQHGGMDRAGDALADADRSDIRVLRMYR